MKPLKYTNNIHSGAWLGEVTIKGIGDISYGARRLNTGGY